MNVEDNLDAWSDAGEFIYSQDTFESDSRSMTRSVSYESRPSLQYSDTFESESIDTVREPTPTPTPRRTLLQKSSSLQEYSDTFTQHDTDSEPENDDLVHDSDPGKTFLDRKLSLLRDDPQESLSMSSVTDDDDNDDGELKSAVAEFCKRKVKFLKSSPVMDRSTEKRRPYKDEVLEDYGLSDRVLERMKLNHFMTTWTKMAKTEIHDPKTCSTCKKQEDKLMFYQILADKTSQLRQRLTEEKLRKLNQETDLKRIGDMLSTLPRFNSDKETIWNKLLFPYTQQKSNMRSGVLNEV